MKIKILVGLLIVLIMINLATLGTYIYYTMIKKEPVPFAPPVYTYKDRRGEPKVWRRLDLTEQQQEQLFELKKMFRERTEGKLDSIRRLRIENLQLLQQEPVPLDKIYQNIEKISRLRKEVDQLAIEHLIESRKILLPEQRQLFHHLVREYYLPHDIFRGPRRMPRYWQDKPKPFEPK